MKRGAVVQCDGEFGRKELVWAQDCDGVVLVQVKLASPWRGAQCEIEHCDERRRRLGRLE